MSSSKTIPNDETILLTGCCGYIGSWITVTLLRAGFRVRGTTLRLEDTRRFFDRLFAGPDQDAALRSRLEIVEADLLHAESWTGLADGCTAVIHTACPVMTDIGAPRHTMLDPATVGTENVVREAARAGGVTRFIHMSSIVTLLDCHKPPANRGPKQVMGPGDWNHTASPQTDPYAHAKVLGERKARALVGELMPSASFASILPGPVLGPPVAGGSVPGSVDKTLAPLLTGQLKTGSVDLYLGVVDVRDVATACVRLVALPRERLDRLEHRARFICVSPPTPSMQDLADAIRQTAPEYASVLPRGRLRLPRLLLLAAMRLAVTREAYSYTRGMLGRQVDYDTSLAQDELSMTWRPVRTSVADTVGWLRAGGHYPPPSPRRWGGVL